MAQKEVQGKPLSIHFIACCPIAPTYGDLIDLLQECEELSAATGNVVNVTEILHQKCIRRFPHITFSRPKRLYDAVMRIVAPTRPSLRGSSKLRGSDLAQYRKKEWTPRTTINTRGMC